MPHWDKYVSKLPTSLKQRICTILDVSGDWKLLGEELGYSSNELDGFALSFLRQYGSASYDLLTDYSCKNPTLRELHKKLKKLKLKGVADLLEEYVDPPNRPVDSQISRPKQVSSSSSDSDENVPDRDLPLPRRSRHKKNKTKSGSQQHIQIRPSDNGNRIPVYTRQEQERISVYRRQEQEIHDYHYLTRHNANPPFRQNSKYSEATNDTVNAYSSPPPAYKTGSYNVCHQSGDNVQNLNAHDELAAQIQWMNFQSNSVQKISYDEITKATYAFDGDYLIDKLHRGNFGKVYNAKIAGTKYAVKFFLPQCSTYDTENVIQPVIEDILRYQHQNLVTLQNFILNGSEICLVYEYMSSGSLATKLHSPDDSVCLSEVQRYRILFDASSCLQYLHNFDRSKSCAHGNIKSMNILLNENLVAKISDFGHTYIAASAYHCNGKTGNYMYETMNTSMAYFPPEFKYKYQMSQSADIFAIGVVILECCTGELPLDSKREGSQLLTSYVNNFLPQELIHIRNQPSVYRNLCDKSIPWNEKLWCNLFLLGCKCIAESEDHRPSVAEVYETIQRIVIASECTPDNISSKVSVQRQEIEGRQGAYNDGIVRQREPIRFDLVRHEHGKHQLAFNHTNGNIEHQSLFKESQNIDTTIVDVYNKRLPSGLSSISSDSFDEDVVSSSYKSSANAYDNIQEKEQIQHQPASNNISEYTGQHEFCKRSQNIGIPCDQGILFDGGVSNNTLSSSDGSLRSGSSDELQGINSNAAFDANADIIQEKPWPSFLSSISSVDSQPDYNCSASVNSKVYLDTEAIRNCDKYGLYSNEKKCSSDPGPRVAANVNKEMANVSVQRGILSGPLINYNSSNRRPIYDRIHFV